VPKGLVQLLWLDSKGHDIAEYAIILAVAVVLGHQHGAIDRHECQQRILVRWQRDSVGSPFKRRRPWAGVFAPCR